MQEAIVNAMPAVIKNAVSMGIGLFIAFIGFQSAGIIVNDESVLLTLGNMKDPSVVIALAGLVITGILLIRRVKGALLIGMLITTGLAIVVGQATLPTAVVSAPPSLKPIFWKFVGWEEILSWDMLIVVFTFLFVDLFDTLGTFIGVSTKAGLLDEKGNVPNIGKALFSDAVGTTVGAMLGTSTVTTYVESASGVAEGGRTGLTALTTGILFLISMIFAPILTAIPGIATAPVLILVGSFMMSPILRINFDDFTEAIPAFLTIIIMPLAYSIAEGLVFGTVSYVLLKLLSGKGRDVHIVMYIIAALFIIKEIVA